MKNFVILLWMYFLCLCHYPLYSQQLYDTEDYKQSTYFKGHYENDEFLDGATFLGFDGHSDDIYTHGTVIDIMHSVFNFSRFFLIESRKEGFTRDYGIQIAQKLYTPTDITSNFIDYSSRPYAGLSYLMFKSISNNFFKGIKIGSSLTIGVTGSISGASEVQTWAHNFMNQPMPNGWKYQIADGIAIDFQNFIDKRIVNLNGFLDVIAQGRMSVGSINNFAQLGGLIRLGIFNDYFFNTFGVFDPQNQKKMIQSFSKVDNSNPKMFLLNHNLQNRKDTLNIIDKFIKRINKKFTIYLTVSPYIGYTLYDGIVSGNLLALKDNVHVLETNKLHNLRFGLKYGIVIGYGRLQITLSEVVNSADVEGERQNNWMSHGILFRF